MAAPLWLRRTCRRLFGKVWTALLDALGTFFDVLGFLWSSFTAWVWTRTLPVTRKYLSRRPKAPTISVKDIRANRIRLKIESSRSSPFNVETYDVQWTPEQITDWRSVGANELTERTVARLKGDSLYRFRVCARNEKGTSPWTPELTARTKIDPVNGGGYGPGYSWTQTSTEVAIAFEVPPGSSKRDVMLSLEGNQRLQVTVRDIVLMEGVLSGKVKGFDKGSMWELTKDYGKMVLTLTLEKVHTSMAPKFDYWRNVVAGHAEIDTHKIPSENTGPTMLSPSQMDPSQLDHFGLGGYGGYKAD